MEKEIKQVAWGYVVDSYGVRAGDQDLESLNQTLNAMKPKGTQRANGKARTPARLSKVKQK